MTGAVATLACLAAFAPAAHATALSDTELPAPVIPMPELPFPDTGIPYTRTTLMKTNWDKLPLGRVTPSGFISQLGGTYKTATAYDDSSIVPHVGGTGRAYRLTLDAKTFKGSAGNNGVNLFLPLPRNVDNACVAYDLRFDDAFDWSLGGKLPGLGGVAPGVSPSFPTGGGNPGAKGWSGRIMWVGPKAYSWAGPNNMAVSYMYSPKMSDFYGDNMRWNKPFARGTWHHIQQCYQLNSVVDGLFFRNGTLEAWIDGAQVVDLSDYLFRSRSDVHLTHLYWSIFRGGATAAWAGSRTSYMDLDNVSVTTIAQ